MAKESDGPLVNGTGQWLYVPLGSVDASKLEVKVTTGIGGSEPVAGIAPGRQIPAKLADKVKKLPGVVSKDAYDKKVAKERKAAETGKRDERLPSHPGAGGHGPPPPYSDDDGYASARTQGGVITTSALPTKD